MIELKGKNIALIEKEEIIQWKKIYNIQNLVDITKTAQIKQPKDNSPIWICINIDDVDDIKDLIRKIQKIEKKYQSIKTDEPKMIFEMIGNKKIKIKEDLIKCMKAIFLTNKREKIEYIYDQVCKDIDEEFEKNNYCDFKNDVCIEKRSGKCKEKITMGCCHKFTKPFFLGGKLKVCPYLKEKKCSAQCLTCKLFTCDAIQRKFKLKEIPLIDCFFNPIQKLIIKSSFFTEREIIIKRLLFFR